MELSNKWSIVLIVVITAIIGGGLVLIDRYYGSRLFDAAVVMLLAIANLITAVSVEKKGKQLKELEKRVDELMKERVND